MEATIMNFQVWMSAGSGPSQKDSTGVAQPHHPKRCGEARILAQQDPLICLWDGWKKRPGHTDGSLSDPDGSMLGSGATSAGRVVGPFC